MHWSNNKRLKVLARSTVQTICNSTFSLKERTDDIDKTPFALDRRSVAQFLRRLGARFPQMHQLLGSSSILILVHQGLDLRELRRHRVPRKRRRKVVVIEFT